MTMRTEPVELLGNGDLTDSISKLGGLSTAINNFKNKYDELQKHLEFIETAITKLNGRSSSLMPAALDNTDELAIAIVEQPQKPTEIDSALMKDSIKRSAIEHLCESMSYRELRKYVTSRLSEQDKLRQEVPPALKLARKPGKLVLDCVGKFFLQGSKAYCKGSHMVTSRLGSILVLELFLLMIGDCSESEVKIEESERIEAEENAIAWKKRLLAEGGMGSATDIDARGLLLLIAGFGIPSSFKRDELRDLLRICKPNEISEALRGSRFLPSRIPGIIEDMMKRGMQVDAVNLVYTFQMVGKYPPETLLISFLRENKEASEKRRRKANNSEIMLKEAHEKQLAGLTSVIRCLETHNIDPKTFLPGWQIKEQIIKLNKDISELSKKIVGKAASKRKMEEIGRINNQELKRSRFAQDEAIVGSSQMHMFHDQRFSNPSRAHDDISNLVHSYLSPSIFHGSGVRTVTDNNNNNNSSMMGGRSYQNSARINQTMSNDARSYGWIGAGSPTPTPTYMDSSSRQNYAVQQSAVGLINLYGQSPSEVCFPGLPNYQPSIATADPNQNPGSDLYAFADIVDESYRNSGSKRVVL